MTYVNFQDLAERGGYSYNAKITVYPIIFKAYRQPYVVKTCGKYRELPDAKETLPSTTS